MRIQLLVVGLAVASGSACTIDLQGGAVAVVEERLAFAVGPGAVEVRLETFDGAIEVRSWDQDEVRVDVTRRAADDDRARELVVETSHEGNRVVVEAPMPDRGGAGFGRAGESVSLTVMVPRALTLEARTGDGSIQADDLAGTIALRTGDGRIVSSRLTGSIDARTGDGSIRMDALEGRVDVDTGDGSVALEGRFEALLVRTGDGSVTVTAADGSVMLDGWSISTGDGSIRLRLPTPFDAEVDAETGDGRVRLEGIDGDEGRDERRAFRGRLGAGGELLSLHTGDGSITLSR